jgi:uncharacterized OB-fold protein
MSVLVQICRDCMTQYFPPRLRCAKCGGRGFDQLLVAGGRLEQTTTLRHRVGFEDSSNIALGLVKTDGGLRLLARLSGAKQSGEPVLLEMSETGSVHERVSDRLRD